MAAELERLQAFFDRPLCREAVGPLRTGVEVKIVLPDATILTLKKISIGVEICAAPPQAPDVSVFLGEASIEALASMQADDVGDIGVGLLKLMANSDPLLKIRTKLHVGIFGFLRNGYLGILPLGGKKVTQFLASKGLSGMGKIKAAIENLRSK